MTGGMVRRVGVVDCGHTRVKHGVAVLSGDWLDGAWPEARIDAASQGGFALETGEIEPSNGEAHNSPLVERLRRCALEGMLRPELRDGGGLAGLAFSVPSGIRSALMERLDAEALLADVPWAVFSPLDDWPVRNGYATPATVGPDRLAACCGAAARANRSGMRPPFLVVTAGTAVTVNWVDMELEPARSASEDDLGLLRPVFRGGAILPGYLAFLEGLAGAAPTLAPAVARLRAHGGWMTEEFAARHPELCGATTPGNLRRGALEGVAGATLQNMRALEREFGREPGSTPVWISGGDAGALAAGIDAMANGGFRPRSVQLAADLVMEGLALTLDWLASKAAAG